jgi:hypothetical protein
VGGLGDHPAAKHTDSNGIRTLFHALSICFEQVTRPALYEDKDVLAVAPWFASLRPVYESAVARPSTATGANSNKSVYDIFPNNERNTNARPDYPEESNA